MSNCAPGRELRRPEITQYKDYNRAGARKQVLSCLELLLWQLSAQRCCLGEQTVIDGRGLQRSRDLIVLANATWHGVSEVHQDRSCRVHVSACNQSSARIGIYDKVVTAAYDIALRFVNGTGAITERVSKRHISA